MLKLQTQQQVEAEQLKRSFCQVMTAVAAQIPQTSTQQILRQITTAIPHMGEVVMILHP